jgi:hypothetical protein
MPMGMVLGWGLAVSDPIMAAVATALVTWATTTAAQGGREALVSLVTLVRKRFQSRSSDRELVERALDGQVEPAHAEPLAELLRRESEVDPEFARQVHVLWRAARAQSDGHPQVANAVFGDVDGTVVQTRDVHGGIHLRHEPR